MSMMPVSLRYHGSEEGTRLNTMRVKPTFDGSRHYVPDRVGSIYNDATRVYNNLPSDNVLHKRNKIDTYSVLAYPHPENAFPNAFPRHSFQMPLVFPYDRVAHLHIASSAHRDRETILREIPRKSHNFIFDLNDSTNVVRGVEGATGGSAALAGIGTFAAHVGVLGPIGLATGTVHGIINALGAGSAVGTGTGIAARALRRSEIEDIHRDFNRTHHRYAERANAAKQDRDGNATIKRALGGDEGYYEHYKDVAKDLDSRIGELLMTYQNVQPGRAETAYRNAGVPLASQKAYLSRLEEGQIQSKNMIA